MEQSYDIPMMKETGSPSDCSVSRFGVCDGTSDTVSHAQAVAIGWEDGRRLYIHQSSFDELALQGASAAELTYSALVALPVVKLVHHDVVEEGVALGLIKRDTAERLRAIVDDTWLPRISVAFRRIFLDEQPLISKGESIVATCVDANYFTFATGEGAARRMYSDFLKLSEVWKLVQARGDLYRDVTMVKGSRLSLPQIQQGATAAFDLAAVKRAIMQRFLLDIAEVVNAALPRDDELPHLTRFRHRCYSVVRLSILRLGRGGGR